MKDESTNNSIPDINNQHKPNVLNTNLIANFQPEKINEGNYDQHNIIDHKGILINVDKNISNSHTSTNDNINNSSDKFNTIKNEESKNTQNIILNKEYYDEFNRPKYEDIVEFENHIRQEIENSSPLVSDHYNSDYLMNEFKNSIFEKAILDVIKKYKNIRTIRRDGTYIL